MIMRDTLLRMLTDDEKNHLHRMLKMKNQDIEPR
jgi:hypothetical protein